MAAYPSKHRYWGIWCPAGHFVPLCVAEMPDHTNPPKPPAELEPYLQPMTPDEEARYLQEIKYYCEKCQRQYPDFPSAIVAWDGPPPPEGFETHRLFRRPQ